MSHNLLFSCVKPGKKFSYNLEDQQSSQQQQQQGQYRPLQEANRSTAQRHGITSSTPAAQGRSNPGPSHGSRSRLGKSPASKKRKTDEGFQEGRMGDDPTWADNDFFLSQENMSKIELMESQAMKVTPVSDPGPPGKTLSLPKPCRYNSAPPAVQASPRGDGIFVRPRPALHTADSTSSTSSVANTGSSGYPSNLTSSTASQSSSSLKSSSSMEIPLGQSARRPSLTAQSSSDSGDSFSTSFLRTPVIDKLKEELEKCKKQVETLQQDKSTLKEELFVKEGAIKILRDNISKKDTELNSAKVEKIKSVEQQNREKSEKEKQLQIENDKLLTQLQFKERDISELQEKNQTLESRLQRSEASEQSQMTRSPSRSPKIRKVLPEEKSPAGRRGFPTRQSFLENVETERPVVPFSRLGKDAATMTVERIEPLAAPAVNRRQRKFELKMRNQRGQMTGAQLMTKLEQCEVDMSHGMGSSTSPCSAGIMALVHSKTPVVDMHQFLFDRDSNKLLSPLLARRLSPNKVQVKSLVAADSYRLVSHGMRCMMCDQDPFLPLESPSYSSSPENGSISESGDLLTLCTNNDKSAMLFLPLLNDYLTRYIELLNISVERGSTLLSPPSSDYSSSAKSSSFDSSLESVSSSLNLLMKDGATYANNLEHHAQCALAVLHTIVSYCPGVRNVLLTPEGTDSDASASHSIMEKRGNKTSKETDSDIVISSPETTDSLITNVTYQKVLDCGLLKKMFRLANPGRRSDSTDKDKKQLYRLQIVLKSLEILIVLSSNATEEQFDSLLPLLSNTVLINCLECEADPQVVLLAVDLMTTFTKFSKAISNVCTNQDGCILCALYSTSTAYLDSFSPDKLVTLSSKVISFLCGIITSHKGGIVFLLEANCRCSIQIVKSVVLLLHRMWYLYNQREDTEVLSILQKGLLLLHVLSQRDAHFIDHHYVVEHQYVQLVCGLLVIFKQSPEKYETEINAVTDLWDFSQDDSELSHDSEEDDSMDIN